MSQATESRWQSWSGGNLSLALVLWLSAVPLSASFPKFLLCLLGLCSHLHAVTCPRTSTCSEYRVVIFLYCLLAPPPFPVFFLFLFLFFLLFLIVFGRETHRASICMPHIRDLGRVGNCVGLLPLSPFTSIHEGNNWLSLELHQLCR